MKKTLKQGQTSPIKARVCAIQTKRMLLAFFSSKGLVYWHIVPREFTINTADIVKVIGIFMKHMKKKRRYPGGAEVIFHWENTPVRTTSLSRIGGPPTVSPVLPHPPY